MRYLRNEQAAWKTNNDIFLKIFTVLRNLMLRKPDGMDEKDSHQHLHRQTKNQSKQIGKPLPVQELAADTGLIDLDHPGTEDLKDDQAIAGKGNCSVEFIRGRRIQSRRNRAMHRHFQPAIHAGTLSDAKQRFKNY